MKYKYRYKSTGWLFQYQERFVQLALRAVYRKMHIHNVSGVPADKPVLLAINHPTAFIDPLFVCCIVDPPVYNMTRGDLFKKPFWRNLMMSVNMFPVYRSRDGYTEAGKNDGVFEYCVEKLGSNHCVAIYVEGEHHLEKRVKTAQKGLGRIAFGAFEEKDIPDLMVIPMSVNYESGSTFRDTIIGYVDEPLYMRDYFEEYRAKPGHALRRLTSDIEARLKAICYHIEKTEDDDFTEQLLEISRNDAPDSIFPIVQYNDIRFKREKTLIDKVNQTENPEKDALKIKATAYFEALEKQGIKDLGFAQKYWGAWSNFTFLVLTMPFVLIALIFHFIPSRFALWFADTKVKKKEFYSSVLTGAGLLLNQLWYFIFLLIGIFTWNPWLIGSLFLMPVLGWLSLVWREAWTNFWVVRKVDNCSEKNTLLEMRSELADWIKT